MCGRYTLSCEKIKEIEEFLNVNETDLIQLNSDDRFSHFNVAPTHEMPVSYENKDNKRILESMHWGYMGWKPKPGKKPFLPINTRDDSITKKPMWKKAFTERRCIIPANGFYEWTGKKGNKTPHYIYPKNQSFLGFAGIYSDLAPEDKSAKRSYSIITTSPNKLMENIHDRMPVILHPEEFNDWLNPNNKDTEFLKDFLRPYPDDAISEHVVSKTVNNVRNNGEELIQKAELF